MSVWRERLPQATQIAAGVASAAWGRFLCGPVGSVGIARWLGAWVAYAFLALLVSTTVLREGSRQVTLWWLFILAWCVSNIASVARAQKRHDPKAWVLAALVFLIGGMAIQSTWLMIGLMLLVAAGIHSRPVEWAIVLVQRVAHWATAALSWLGAWALFTNMGVAALEPAMRTVNPRGAGAFNAGLSAMSTVFSAGAALLMLCLLICGYRRLREQWKAA